MTKERTGTGKGISGQRIHEEGATKEAITVHGRRRGSRPLRPGPFFRERSCQALHLEWHLPSEGTHPSTSTCKGTDGSLVIKLEVETPRNHWSMNEPPQNGKCDDNDTNLIHKWQSKWQSRMRALPMAGAAVAAPHSLNHVGSPTSCVLSWYEMPNSLGLCPCRSLEPFGCNPTWTREPGATRVGFFGTMPLCLCLKIVPCDMGRMFH